MVDVSFPLDPNEPLGARFTTRRIVEVPTCFAPPSVRSTGVSAAPVQNVVRVAGVSIFSSSTSMCRVCSSPRREEIERLLGSGMSIPKIASLLAGDDIDGGSPLSESSLYGHRRKHMSLDATIARETVEQRAQLVGASPESGVVGTVAFLSLLDTVLRRTMEHVATGKQTPSIKDGLAAGKLMMEIEDRIHGQVAVEEVLGALSDMASIVGDLVPENRRDELVQRMNDHPVLAQVIQRMMATRMNSVAALPAITVDEIYAPDEYDELMS